MLSAVEKHLNSQFAVKTALDFAAIGKKPIQGKRPTLFVLPLGIQTLKEDRDTGPELVRQVEKFGIVTALRSTNDLLGGTGNEALKHYRKQIYALLFGWVPETGYDPIMVGNGRLLAFRDQTLFWIDEFYTSHLEQAQQ